LKTRRTTKINAAEPSLSVKKRDSTKLNDVKFKLEKNSLNSDSAVLTFLTAELEGQKTGPTYSKIEDAPT